LKSEYYSSYQKPELICCDIEGASSVDNYRQIAPFWRIDGYEDCIRAITIDVNSAVRGLKRAGAVSIDIFDGHGDGENLRQDMIEGDAVSLLWVRHTRLTVQQNFFLKNQ
jgi:D-aminopeptidase